MRWNMSNLMFDLGKMVDNPNEEEICALCLVFLTDKNNGRTFETVCGHRFHGGCIHEYCIDNGFSCTVCKADMIDPTIKHPQ